MSLHAFSRRFLLGASLLAASTGALAAEQVGRVLLAAGDTFAVRDGQTVRLAFNSPVEFKDVLRTGPASSLQVRFVDDSLLSVRESSEFAIEEYQFGAKPEEQRSFFRLIKGGFRAVTGLIGRTNHANYRVSSQTATIGIRGTDYAVRDCQGDCGPGVKNGLYGTVLGLSNGTNQITVSNQGGEGVFSTNQSFYVPDANTRPQPLLVPPSFVSVKPQGKASASSQGGNGTGGEKAGSNSGVDAESRPSGTPTITGFNPVYVQPFQVTETLNTTGASAVLPPANGFVAVYGLSPLLPFGDIVFDGDNLAATFNGQNQLLTFGTLGTFPSGSLASGSVTDAGSLTLANGQTFSWGRWTGNTQVTISDGQTITGVPVLFGTASGLQQNNTFVGTVGGAAAYAFAGGPRPVDAGGNVGSVTSSSLTIDFTHLSANYSLGMSFPTVLVSGVNTGSAVFNVSGTGFPGGSGIFIPPTATGHGEFDGVLTGTCSGAGCFSSAPIGFFSVGLTGAQGYEFGVVPAVVFGTQAGDVASLNAYQVTTFTPGPAPTGATGPLTGQVAYSAQSPVIVASVQSLATFTTTYNAAGQPISFSLFGNPPIGNLGTGSIVEAGSTTLSDNGAMNWGRWSGGQVTDPVAGLITPPSGVPFVVGNANTTIPVAGSFTYSLAGGPNATTAAGVVGGALTQGAFNISFSPSNISMSVATPLMFTIPTQGTYSLNSFSSVDASACSGGVCSTLPVGVVHNMTFNATCGSGSCISVSNANATGFLVGPQAAGYAVAGNVFSNAASTSLPVVTFAGAFKHP